MHYLTDEKLKEAIDVYNTYKTDQACADHLGIAKSTFQHRRKTAVGRGYSPDHDMVHMAAEGHMVKGVSTLYGKDGSVTAQWIKTDLDKERQELAQKAVIEAMCEEIPKAKKVDPPKKGLENLMAVYPVGDHHMGMLAWGEETGGDNYDLKKSEDVLCRAMDYLVDAAPASKTSAILLLGDFLHFNGRSQETVKGGHAMDADSRFQKVVRAAIKSIRYLVRAALQKHDTVHLIIELGNHDADPMAVFMEMFYSHYEDEPRVIADRSPRNIHVVEFGKNLIATHHGDKIKMDKLPLVIATDFPKIWGRTDFRVVHTGHVHHDHIKEHPGLTTESHGILAPKDEYAASGGWRARQTMKLVVYHKEFGEVGRTIATPQMIGE
tara:strand:+ start:13686 stop:14822 length:1137 start_codon:yes stop_codon:yes gene_type:complete